MEPLQSDPPVKSNYSLRTRQIVDSPKHDDALSLKINTQKAGIPEELSSNPAKKLVRYRTKRNRKETPEQKARRLLKYKERQEAKRAMETPEQYAERRLKANELAKNYRRLRLAREPEKYAELNKKNYQKQKKKYEMETPEQTDRLLKKAEYKKIRQMQLDSETPEQKAERREKQRLRYNKRLSMETPEQKTGRILRSREKYRRLRKMETPEQRAERLAKDKNIRMLHRMERDTFKANAGEVPTVRLENIDDDFDETCTWSSFGRSEGLYSQASKDGRCSQLRTTTEDNSMLLDSTDATSEVKSKPSGIFKIDFEKQSPSCSKTIEDLDKKLEIEKKILGKKQRRQLKNKKYRDGLRAKWAMETPEQTAERKLNAKEALRIANLLRLAKETPEKAAERMAKTREHRKKKRTLETAEQKAKRILMKNEYKKRIYMQRKMETPEQTAERLRIRKERADKIRQLKLARDSPKKLARIIRGTEKDPFECKVKLENIDEDLDESCTWSSLGGSEGTSIDGSCSRTATTIEEYSMMEVNENVSGDLIEPALVQDVIVKEEIIL